MGSGSWSSSSWSSYSSKNIYSRSAVSGSSGIYSASDMATEFNPKNIEMRESRDSVEHPNSTPIIIALDVTGSMSPVLKSVAHGLDTLVTEIYNKKPVEDPQIMFMGVGDVFSDRCPLQVTQFESDIRIAEHLQKIYFEQRGGGNDSESYHLPWYFAANYIQTDAKEKHNKKGFLFTMGDECAPPALTREQIMKVFGNAPQCDSFTTEELLNAVSRDYEVFHLIIEEGNFYSGRYRNHDGERKVNGSWGELLGQNAIHVADHTKIPEIIVSTLQAMSGVDTDTIVSEWDGTTGVVVRKAIDGLTVNKKENGLVEF